VNTYRVAFRFTSGNVDTHTLRTDSGVFSGWNSEIRKDGTIHFTDTDGDRVSVNTKFLETYFATKVS
jgi:hypothetical protein